MLKDALKQCALHCQKYTLHLLVGQNKEPVFLFSQDFCEFLGGLHFTLCSRKNDVYSCSCECI